MLREGGSPERVNYSLVDYLPENRIKQLGYLISRRSYKMQFCFSPSAKFVTLHARKVLAVLGKKDPAPGELPAGEQTPAENIGTPPSHGGCFRHLTGDTGQRDRKLRAPRFHE